MLNDDKNYKLGMFYHNKKDARTFMKNTRNTGGFNGFAINYAHPIGKIIGFGTAFLLIGVIVYTIVVW